MSKTRAESLREDFDVLGQLLSLAEGSGAAAIARERRLIGAELERLESPGKVPFVDEVAQRRERTSGDPRPASRRRKSG